MKQAVIVACGRSAFGRIRGSLRATRPEDLCAQVVQGVLAQVPEAVRDEIEDFVLGCAFPEGQQGANMARNVAGLAGLPVSVAAQTVNRYCSSGLQSIATAAYSIMCGQQRVALAGGVESMTAIPMGGARMLPSPELMDAAPQYYMSMGLTAEKVAQEYHIPRSRMDAFALSSHQKAQAAQDAGYFAEEIVPVKAVAPDKAVCEENRRPFTADEGIRPQTTLESLGKLRPVFMREGSVTAGNASQMTDGAAAVLLMEEDYARELGLQPLARFVSFAVAGVRAEVMGIGPIAAIPKALELANLTLADIDFIELNEAFAAQALACMDVLGLDPERVNVNGGAIALGHPLGCTGSALTVRLLRQLKRSNARYGIVSMCIGGGQGAAGIFECL